MRKPIAAALAAMGIFAVLQGGLIAVPASAMASVETPPSSGETPPSSGETPPSSGETPPSSGETPPSSEETPPASGEAAPAAEAVRTLWASFHLQRVSLINGRAAENPFGELSPVPATLTGNFPPGFHVNPKPGESSRDGAAIFEVAMLGEPSGYWVKARVADLGSGPFAECSLYRGDPANGGTPPSDKPFTCKVDKDPDRFDSFTFFLRLSSFAESSGTIATAGSDVTLVNGKFSTGLPYTVPGADALALNSSTAFGTVLRNTDVAVEDNQARIQFQYQIVDKGVPLNLWVAGYSTNFHGNFNKFTGAAGCAIYDASPAKVPGLLEKQPTVDISAYTCTWNGDYVHGEYESGNGHYRANFTVSRRATQIVSDPVLQHRLLAENCADSAANCGISLSTVTDGIADPIRLTKVLANPAGTDVTQTYSESHTEGVALKIGSSFETTAETNWIFEKLTFTFKFSIEVDVSSTTTTSTGYNWILPARHSGYLAGSPHMLHAVGTIIVKDHNGTYWELPQAEATLPAADNYWAYAPILTPLEGAVGPTPDDAAQTTNPADLTRVATDSAGRLAKTGVMRTTDPLMIGGLLLLTGGVLGGLSRLRHRSLRTRRYS